MFASFTPDPQRLAPLVDEHGELDSRGSAAVTVGINCGLMLLDDASATQLLGKGENVLHAIRSCWQPFVVGALKQPAESRRARRLFRMLSMFRARA